MNNIVVWDCKAGAFNIVSKLMTTVTAEYRYFVDVDNDYGSMTADELKSKGLAIADKLVTNDTDCVVIADSNMSMQCISALRSKYPEVVFVGYEPPIQHAVQYTVSEVLLLCSPFVSRKVGNVACVKVCEVDEDLLGADKPLRTVRQLLEEKLGALEGTFDCIALGNSCYWHLCDVLKGIFPAVKIFDGGDGIVSRLKKLFKRKDWGQESVLNVIFSSDSHENSIKYCKLMGEISKYY